MGEPHQITPEEALAAIEYVGGTRLCRGVAVPPYVLSDDDLARWANAQRWAADSLELPPTAAPVQQLTRTIYLDREQFPS